MCHFTISLCSFELLFPAPGEKKPDPFLAHCLEHSRSSVLLLADSRQSYLSIIEPFLAVSSAIDRFLTVRSIKFVDSFAVLFIYYWTISGCLYFSWSIPDHLFCNWSTPGSPICIWSISGVLFICYWSIPGGLFCYWSISGSPICNWSKSVSGRDLYLVRRPLILVDFG